jgi:heme exporter protein A
VTETALASPEAAPSAPPLLVASGLSRRFGDRWAVAGVNLRLSAGRSLLLAGHNGAGKTTLLQLLAGLLRPTAGTLTLDRGGRGGPPPRVGLIGHRGGHWQDLGADEHLRIDAHLLGRRFDRAEARALLARVGLDGRDREPVRQFSAGMSKRLSLARLLYQDPEVVLLDEPYGKLDHDGTALMDGVVDELVARGKALVMATHLVSHVAHRLHSGLVLDGGEMRWVGPASGVPAILAKESE